MKNTYEKLLWILKDSKNQLNSSKYPIIAGFIIGVIATLVVF